MHASFSQGRLAQSSEPSPVSPRTPRAVLTILLPWEEFLGWERKTGSPWWLPGLSAVWFWPSLWSSALTRDPGRESPHLSSSWSLWLMKLFSHACSLETCGIVAVPPHHSSFLVSSLKQRTAQSAGGSGSPAAISHLLSFRNTKVTTHANGTWFLTYPGRPGLWRWVAWRISCSGPAGLEKHRSHHSPTLCLVNTPPTFSWQFSG